MADLRKNIGLATVGFSRRTGAAHPLNGGGRYAYSLGRRLPFQAAQGSRSLVLGEVASGLYSTDAAGVAYPAGTLWVRAYCARDFTGSAGDGADLESWMAVPDTLPSGYTSNPRRNIRPNGGMYPFITAYSVEAYHFPNPTWASYFLSSNKVDTWPYLVTNGGGETTDGHSANGYPIRTANGVYYPFANTLRTDGLADGCHYPWGPLNMDDSVYGPFDMPMAQPAVTGFDSVYLPYSAGWRNVHLNFTISAAVGAIVLASWPTTTVTIEVDGAGTHTYTAAMMAAGINDTWDHGPSSQQVPGTLYQTRIKHQVDNFGGDFNPGALTITCSPRVNIPLPWTVTSGNLVAPGGIVAGTIPGY